MAPSTILAEVINSTSDWSGSAAAHLADAVPLAIRFGITADADVVLVATVADDHVQCGIVFGSTLLVGTRMRHALNVCVGDQRRVDFLLDRLRKQAAEDLQNGGFTVRFSCGSDERWRSFRGERLLGLEALGASDFRVGRIGDSSWHEIKSAEVKEDGSAESLAVAKSTGHVFYFLNFGVHGFADGVGDVEDDGI